MLQAFEEEYITLLATLYESRDFLNTLIAKHEALKQNVSIEVLNLPLRIESCLKVEGLVIIPLLCGKSRLDLLKTPNLGRTSVEVIERALAFRGEHLRKED